MDHATDPPTKVCTRCSESKPHQSFSPNKIARDGRKSQCKACVAEAKRERRLADPQKYREADNRLRAANREKFLERDREYRRLNREAVVESQRKWRLAHLDEQKRRERAWREANVEAVRRKNAEYKLTHPDYWRVYGKRWRAENPDLRRETDNRRRALLAAAKVGDVDLKKLRAESEGICPLCGESINFGLKYPDPLSQSVDHIVPLARGGTHEQANLQWVHLVCNVRKGARLL